MPKLLCTNWISFHSKSCLERINNRHLLLPELFVLQLVPLYLPFRGVELLLYLSTATPFVEDQVIRTSEQCSMELNCNRSSAHMLFVTIKFNAFNITKL